MRYFCPLLHFKIANFEENQYPRLCCPGICAHQGLLGEKDEPSAVPGPLPGRLVLGHHRPDGLPHLGHQVADRPDEGVRREAHWITFEFGGLTN